MLKRSKKRIIILAVIFFTILICVLWNVYEYLALKKEAAYYLNKRGIVDLDEPVDLVGLLDSYGVPYSPSVDKSFFGYLEEDLEEAGLLSSSLDLYGLYINKTWELNGIFRNDVTIGEMKTMQNFGMDFVRHKYGKERIREDLIYTCDGSLEDVTVASYYTNLKRPMVLYSCAANDLFYYFNVSLESLNLIKIFKLIMNFKNGLSLLESEVKSNLELLTAYNPNAVIIVMGLYVPSDNLLFQRLGNVIIGKVNRSLECICDEFTNVYFADVSCLSFAVLQGDFHPNEEGHEILKNILETAITSTYFTDQASRPVITIDKETKTGDETEDPCEHLTIDEILTWLEESDLPTKDYTECAVAMEVVLFKKGYSNISFRTLERLKKDCTIRNLNKESLGIEILAIERKIHYEIDMRNVINKEVKNDKISLIPFLMPK